MQVKVVLEVKLDGRFRGPTVRHPWTVHIQQLMNNIRDWN